MRESNDFAGLPLAALIDHTPCGGIIVDEAGTVLAVNHELCRLLGYVAEELVGQPYSMLVPVESRRAHAVHHAKYNAAPEARRMGEGLEVEALHRDGRHVAVEIALNAIQAGGRQLTLAFLVDIGARKQLERDLVKSEADLRELLDQVPEALVVFDIETHAFVDANAAALRFFELTSAQLLKTGLSSMSPEVQADGRGSREALSAQLEILRSRGTGVFEWRTRSSGGLERTCEIHVNRLPSTPNRFRAILVDLTARRTAEQRYRILFESSADGVLVLDRQGMIVEANACAATISRVRGTDQLVGRAWIELIALPDRAKAAAGLHSMLSGARVELANLCFAVPADDHRLVDLTGNAMVLNGVPHMMIMLRDVTARQHLLGQLATSDRMISIGMLASGVAHEINNPLACVFVNLELAIRQLEGLPTNTDASMLSQLREELADSCLAAEQVRRIVGDLRLFSRATSPQTGPVDVAAVIDSSVRMAWNEIRHRARVTKRLDPVPKVALNEGKLGQILLNLVVNAAQAIPDGHAGDNEIVVSTRVDERGWVAIDVTDTGTGLSPETMKRLFTSFFTTKPADVGTGLGLSISRRIAREAGGDITARNGDERGAVFTLCLPPADLSRQSGAPQSPAAASASPRGRVLVVDDERAVGVAVGRALRSEHDVFIEISSERALERLERGERFDVIITDLMMPQLNGEDLYAAIRVLDPAQAARVVFMTGGAFTSGARAFLAGVPNRCVDKPFETATLRAAVSEARAR